MAKEKTLSRVKVIVNDPFERYVTNDRISGVSFSVSADEKVVTIDVPKARVRSNEQPDKIVEGEKTNMYFSRRRSGGYGFQMAVNVPLFKAIGEDVIVDEFRQCVRELLKEVG